MRLIVQLFMIAMAIVFLAGCGDHGKTDGNVVDSVSLDASWQFPVSFIETFSSLSPLHYDPAISSTVTPTGSLSFAMYAGYTGTHFDEYLLITTVGADLKSYVIDRGEATVIYGKISAGRQFVATTGAIILLGVQQVGGRVSGAFTVFNNRDGISGSFIAYRE